LPAVLSVIIKLSLLQEAKAQGGFKYDFTVGLTEQEKNAYDNIKGLKNMYDCTSTPRNAQMWLNDLQNETPHMFKVLDTMLDNFVKKVGNEHIAMICRHMNLCINKELILKTDPKLIAYSALGVDPEMIENCPVLGDNDYYKGLMDLLEKYPKDSLTSVSEVIDLLQKRLNYLATYKFTY